MSRQSDESVAELFRSLLWWPLLSIGVLWAGGRALADPTSADEQFENVRAWERKKDYHRAIEEATKMISVHPKDYRGWMARGTLQFVKKQYAPCVKDMDEAIRLDRGGLSFNYSVRGAALYKLKEYERAVRDLDEAIRLDPKNSDALNSRAWAAAVCPEAKFRDAKKALEYAKKAYDLPDGTTPFTLGTLAAAYAANGQFDEAVRAQTKALDDADYTKEYGDEGRKMLKLFVEGKPYLEE
jgi:tetratricopeptide (TPR) repeat protein